MEHTDARECDADNGGKGSCGFCHWELCIVYLLWVSFVYRYTAAVIVFCVCQTVMCCYME